MSKEDLKMWQKVIIDEIPESDFAKFIENRFKYLADNMDKYGFWEMLDRINLNDYPDPEFHKLIGYYKQHKDLLSNYIKMKSGNDGQ